MEVYLMMNERIKKLRKDSGLNQKDFGEKIKIVRSSVAKLETGENNPSDRTIDLICRVFNVNEKWLRTGEGPVYKEKQGITEYIKNISDEDYLIKDIIEVYMELDSDSKAALRNIAEKMCAKINERNSK